MQVLYPRNVSVCRTTHRASVCVALAVMALNISWESITHEVPLNSLNQPELCKGSLLYSCVFEMSRLAYLLRQVPNTKCSSIWKHGRSHRYWVIMQDCCNFWIPRTFHIHSVSHLSAHPFIYPISIACTHCRSQVPC